MTWKSHHRRGDVLREVIRTADDRLDGRQPLDLENAVALAWLNAAEDMPGTRAVIDHHVAHPTSPEMARALSVATAKEHEMLALMAARASAPGAAAARVGRSIELAARTSYVP